jgi:Tfp pilus assembly protein PilE
MSDHRTSAASRAPLPARVAACLAAEAGDTLIEVMIAAVLVAVIAIATFMGYTGVAHVAGGQNARAAASALAESDQARLRGLTLDSLGSSGAGTGNYTAPPVTIDGTAYTVSSTSKFVAATGSTSCTTSGTSNADEVQTTSAVSWPSDGYAGGPVEIHGLVAPQQGGSLIARVVDQNGNGVSGVTITLSGGPTSASPLTTDSSGCAVWAGLAGGAYTATASENGYLTPSGATSATATETVVPTETAPTANFTLGQEGGVTASFNTVINGTTYPNQQQDQVVAYNSSLSQYNVFGTNNTYGATISSGNLYYPTAYSVYAGSCAGDQPATGVPTAALPSVVVTGNTGAPVTVQLPAMIIEAYGAGPNVPVDDPASSAVVYTGSHWTHSTTATGDYQNTESYDATGGDYVTFTFTGTSVEWIGPKNTNQGYADVYLDGTKVQTNVNTYGSSTYLYTFYTSPGLANTSHTLEIYVDGTKPSGSSAANVPIDEFIYGTATLLTAAPYITITDNNGGCASAVNIPATQVPTPTGGALVYPGQPYGHYTVCASSGGFKNTASVANTNYTTGTTANIYLGTGSPGLQAGSCP